MINEFRDLVSREHKDRLFCFLFGNEKNKKYTLSLYNAINGSSYEDPDIIEINTLESVVYLGMHNDVSFLICDEMNLYEQQSSYCPNMPIRMLQYAALLYEKHMKRNGMSKYSSSLLKLPVPRLVVFYNGKRDRPAEEILRLTDAFGQPDKSDIEVTVRMINVNAGHNRDIIDKCRPLFEYAWLIAEMRRREGQMLTLEEIINEILKKMPDDFEIKSLLMENKAEVIGMLLSEYSEADEMERLKNSYRKEGLEEGRQEGHELGLEEGRQEGRELGLEEGRQEGREEGIRKMAELMRELGLPDADILSRLREKYDLDEQKATAYLHGV